MKKLERNRNARQKEMKLFELLIAAFACAYAVFISPKGMSIAVGQNQNVMIMAVGTAACFLGVLVLTAFLVYTCSRTRPDRASVAAAAKKTAAIFFIYLAAALLLSLFNGILATGIYHLAAGHMELSEIKGIISYTATALTLGAVPAVISIFWAMVCEEKVKQGLMEGIKSLKHTYLKLLILSLLLFGGGIVVTTLCNHIGSPAAAQFTAMILLTAMGFAAFHISEAICSRKTGGVN